MAGNRRLETIAALFVLLLVTPTAPGRETERPSLGKAADRVLKQFEHINSIADAHEYFQRTRPDCISHLLRASFTSAGMRTSACTGGACSELLEFARD